MKNFKSSSFDWKVFKRFLFPTLITASCLGIIIYGAVYLIFGNEAALKVIGAYIVVLIVCGVLTGAVYLGDEK